MEGVSLDKITDEVFCDMYGMPITLESDDKVKRKYCDLLGIIAKFKYSHELENNRLLEVYRQDKAKFHKYIRTGVDTY